MSNSLELLPKKPLLSSNLILALGLVALFVSYSVLSDLKTKESKLISRDSVTTSASTKSNRHTSNNVSASNLGDITPQKEIIAATEVIDAIALPWDQLFQGLQSASMPEVTLLGVTPDNKQQLINITGEAKSFADLLTYTTRLRAYPAFKRVYLNAQEVKKSDPQLPILFSVQLHWKYS